MEISEGVILLGLRPRRKTPSSISIILHKILSLIINNNPTGKYKFIEESNNNNHNNNICSAVDKIPIESYKRQELKIN